MEYNTTGDLFRDYMKDVENYTCEFPTTPLHHGAKRVPGLENELRNDVESPFLKRLKGKTLNQELQNTLRHLEDKFKRCKEKGRHTVILGVYVNTVEGKNYIAGLCSSCGMVVVKEMTDDHRKKIAEYNESQERLMHMPVF